MIATSEGDPGYLWNFVLWKLTEGLRILSIARTSISCGRHCLGYFFLGYKATLLHSINLNCPLGALNNAAAKKYDLEAWFPHQGEYKVDAPWRRWVIWPILGSRLGSGLFMSKADCTVIGTCKLFELYRLPNPRIGVGPSIPSQVK